MAATGLALPPFESDHAVPFAHALSPDGRTLATGTHAGLVELWEMATGRRRCVLKGHCGPVGSLAFSADGRRLASGSEDTTALLWDVVSAARANQPVPPELSANELDALWADLRADDGAAAYRAINVLAAVPKQAVPYLRARLKVVTVDPQRLKQLVADLDSAEFETRQQAFAELEALYEVAEPSLRDAVKDPPSAEVRRRAKDLLEKAKMSAFEPTGEALRAWRALEALEQCGTAEARTTLQELAKGDDKARRTRAARLAVERLQRRQTSPE